MSNATDVPFVHLHNHSDYSLLDGAMKVKDLAARAAELEMPAVALTDHGNLFGAVGFYLACQKQGVKPILGMEAYVVEDHKAPETERAGGMHHLILLASNETGWKNLVKLSSLGYREGLAGKPRVDKELLHRHREGLIASGSCLQGEVNAALMAEDLGWARRALGEHHDIFGRDGFFVEIQNHGTEAQARQRALAGQLAIDAGARLLATNNCHYLRRNHAASHDVLMAIQAGRTVDDPTRSRYESDQLYVKSSEEMRAAFLEFPDAYTNAFEIAARCDVELKLGEHLLPIFPLPAGFDSLDDYLRKLSYDGAVERYGEVDDRMRKRLDYELDVIKTTGFAGYFLITSDFVIAAKEMGIPVGPGRGSAAGSLVCYCVRITDVDPLAHGLLFERFLNPERISMPDIDIDFCFERRGEVIEYVTRKYGQESVCQIITYGAMLARGVLRDVGRALGFAYGETDRIAKLVPEQLGITLGEALEETEELRAVRDDDPRCERLIHTALELEGLYRHASIHAAGVLIAPGDLTDHTPLYMSSDGEVTTQWDMKMVEAMGLLKMDFLGLRTLTVIEKALEFVRAGGDPALAELRAEDIDLDDPSVYELLSRGETVGIFQLESSGMQEVLRKLQPSRFDDITAVNALYRPGPLEGGMVDDFIDRKHGRKPISYLHPLLAPILEETYGVILYQEQVMRIAGDMAGFSMGQADTLRKAMGKKNKEVMSEMEKLFVEGSVERDVDRAIAQKIFDLMAFFAGYGFNKSHSASYAVLSLQTAWLKTHHPSAFMASTLTSQMSNSTRVVALIDEVKHLGIPILPPDVNSCTADFRSGPEGIRFGLGAVKNVGLSAIEAIVEAREELGNGFASLYEFCETVDLTRVNRRVIESLILAGAMDTLPGRREQKLAGLDLALARAQRRARDRDRGQSSLFGAVEEKERSEGVLPEVEVWTESDRLAKEKELIGFYLTGHPLNDVRYLLDWIQPDSTRDLDVRPDDTPMVICGVVHSVKTVTTRASGRLMAFVELEDFRGTCEVICFPETYESYRRILSGEEMALLCAGRTSVRENEAPKLMLEKALTLDDACAALLSEIHLELPIDLARERVDGLLEAVAAHPGSTSLVLHLKDRDFETELRATRASVRPSPALLDRLIKLLGIDAVRAVARPASALMSGEERRGRRRRPRGRQTAEG